MHPISFHGHKARGCRNNSSHTRYLTLQFDTYFLNYSDVTGNQSSNVRNLPRTRLRPVVNRPKSLKQTQLCATSIRFPLALVLHTQPSPWGFVSRPDVGEPASLDRGTLYDNKGIDSRQLRLLQLPYVGLSFRTDQVVIAWHISVRAQYHTPTPTRTSIPSWML
jgi:hypothetical protein